MVQMGVEWKVLVKSLALYYIHIHSICLKSKEAVLIIMAT